MKKTFVVLAGVAAALAACGSEPKSEDHSEHGEDHSMHGGSAESTEHPVMPLSDKAKKDKKEAAGIFMKRFGIEACADVDLLGSVRQTSPESGELMIRSFQTSEACATETLAKLKQSGFTEAEPDTFVGKSPDGADEKIDVRIVEENSAGLIEWESAKK
jgi:hypothetical protein